MDLYLVLKRMIERGQTEDIQEKIDVLWVADRLTKQQYDELQKMLGA